jgi:hypothetical protein
VFVVCKVFWVVVSVRYVVVLRCTSCGGEGGWINSCQKGRCRLGERSKCHG